MQHNKINYAEWQHIYLKLGREMITFLVIGAIRDLEESKVDSLLL